ncbi:MAG: hypothetical protein RIS35_3645 [Pseudomonadota bacterium]|jgi:putative tricarboxylic transport membrane protein
MTLIAALAAGLAHVLSWPGILIPIAGTLLAMVVSFLPGIGSASLMAVALVLTLSWDPVSVLLLFGALTGGATFMGSITAILFNIPGGAPSAAVLLDGHPLGRQGRARTAIACAATASALGSVFGVVVLIALLPVVRPFLLEFGPVERLLLGVWGLTTIVAVPNTPPLKSAAMAVMGLLAAMVGADPATGEARWTFGVTALEEGFGAIPVLLGIFTLAELIGWARGYRVDAGEALASVERDSARAGILATLRHPGLVLRSSVIGTLVGIVPGVGGTVASFVAYGQAVQSARGDRSRFGKGDIRGVIAPEAAVDAKDGGSLLPAVAFGLPGSEAGVMLVSVFAVHGLVPGVPMLGEQLPMTMTLILALLFSNLLTSVVGVLLTPWLAGLTALRVDRLALPVLFVSILAIVQVNGNLNDLVVAAAFGILGYLLKRHGWPRVPFVIAFVLGEFLVGNLHLTLRLLELGRVEPLQRPVTLVILGLTVASMLWMYRRTQPTGSKASFTRRDAAIGLVCVALCATLLVASLSSDGWRSLHVTCSTVGILLSLPFAFRGWSSTTSVPVPDRGSPNGLFPGLLALPLTAPALGLPIALGLLLLIARWADRGESPRSLVRELAQAGLLAFGSSWLFEDVLDLLLPTGWIPSLVIEQWLR